MTERIEREGSESFFSVVINHEGQYSIWPLGREMPGGWQEEGKTGSKNECLEYINEIWSDISPRSITGGAFIPIKVGATLRGRPCT